MFRSDINRPLNLNNEHWDMFAADYDQEQRDWQEQDLSKWADLIDPSTINAFEGGES
jgi:hypothetical protein